MIFLKKHKWLSISLLTIIIASGFFFSYSLDLKESDFVGKWEVTNVAFDMPDLSPQLLESAKQEFISDEYFMGADHTLTIRNKLFARLSNGRWEFNENTNILTMQYEEGGSFVNQQFETYQLSSSVRLVTTFNQVGKLSLTIEKASE